MDGQNNQQPANAPVVPQASAPVATKTYSSSFVPEKAVLIYPKPVKATMALWHIEVIHVVIFFLLLVGLFYKMWGKPNLR